jgi:hypothetical protein
MHRPTANQVDRIPRNPPKGDGRYPLPETIPQAPLLVSEVRNKKPTPTFINLKNIIKNTESLSAEQKFELIDKISELYA